MMLFGTTKGPPGTCMFDRHNILWELYNVLNERGSERKKLRYSIMCTIPLAGSIPY